MRFLADGPAIPNQLLEQRDLGRVVFFCGAGVSIPTGLGDFRELTEDIVDRLGVPGGSRIRRLLALSAAPQLEAIDPDLPPSYDQIFRLLERPYPKSRIDREVSRKLRTPPRADLSCHETILRLSTSATGKPFVVTTNFDRLFEKANKTLRRWIPPHLPDLSVVAEPTGVVYLHGRASSARRDSESLQDLVLSSSDFGRAYLADGWATRFFKQLLATHTVVLLGYSASDPPMRYLLEGLGLQSRPPAPRLYALDIGAPGDVEERWHSLGVTGIPYNDHGLLWQTLAAWADRADDPLAWREAVVHRAQRPPRELQPFERGQVASLVSTAQGARAFARAEPPPPAEWICVFDAATRYEESASPPGAEAWPRTDLLPLYHLDDDPPRPDPHEAVPKVRGGIHLIQSLPEDESKIPDGISETVANHNRRGNNRLQALIWWLGRVAHESFAIW